ncbi:hypothetical protein C7N83_13280, partial [Neisseria iguanae]
MHQRQGFYKDPGASEKILDPAPMVRFIFTVIWHLMSERYANGGNARWMRYIPSSGPMPSAVK